MRALLTVSGLLGLFGVMAGCAAATGDDATASSNEELSTSTASYVTVSQPECIKAPCPPYFVQDMNKTTGGQTVGNLDFSGTSFTKDTITKITSAPAGEIVLKGKLGPVQSKTHLPSFIVAEAYRGLPGVTYGSTAAFYQGGDYSPPINCFAAPCAEGTVKKLNTTTTSSYDSIDVTPAAKAFVNQDFLHAQIAADSAIVAGSIVKGPVVGTRATNVLTASQIFVKMPAGKGPCMQFVLPACPDGQVRTYTRAANFCDVPADCVTRGPCTRLMPSCSDGYTLSSWASDPNGCSAFACDPTFIVQ